MSETKTCECKTVLQKIKTIIDKYNCACCTAQETPEPSVVEQAHNPDCQCDPCECENCECKPEQETQPPQEVTIIDDPEPEPEKPLKKYALLFGLNYIGSNAELGGCINDVVNMEKILKEKYNFDEILRTTDLGITQYIKKSPKDVVATNKSITPTYNTMVSYIKLLKNKTYENDVVYFHYSGHGSYVRDQNNDERDGKDECLVPIDYNKYGFITDDLIKSVIKDCNPKCKVIMVIDACHSATMADLRYQLDCKSVQLEQNQTDSNAYLYQNWSYNFEYAENHKYSDSNNVFTISGCRDNQTSADAWINNKYQGALSYHFMKTLELNNYKLPIKYLLKDIHCMLKLGQYDQKPVITSTKKIDIDQEFTL